MNIPAVFLDRDDTLMACRDLPAPPPPANPGDLVDPEQVRLLPGALEACALLVSLGYVLIVVTNQGVVARGGITLATLEQIHERLRVLLSSASGEPFLTDVYACPFHPLGRVEPFNVEHPWRKPGAGMVLAAAADHEIDLSRSWMIGDSVRDIECAVRAGIAEQRALLIGKGCEWAGVLEGARWIAEQRGVVGPVRMPRNPVNSTRTPRLE